MKIVNFIAQNIAEELKDIIKQDINYFDEKGCIIASTDKDRVGEFHWGAKRSIDLKDDIIIKYDEKHKGAKIRKD